VEGHKIKWSAISIKQFNAAIDYISLDSPQNAENVQNKILNKLERIAQSPGICPPDKYKKKNNNNYRAFSIFRYMISYRIENDGIEILRIRHTSMKPKFY